MCLDKDLSFEAAGATEKLSAAVYASLLGKKSGPKAGPFVAGLGAPFVRERFARVSGDTEGSDDGR